jgi:DNA (cytosine-5)-methyltransferase 1
MLNVLDLFSGIGGFSLGLERTGGFQTVAFCEIEPFPRSVLKKHWPNVPVYEDVKKLSSEQLKTDGITVDVICGGFPCQDISFAGKGAGLDGERSGLWFEFHRLIEEICPQYAIIENVSALRSRGLDAVLRSLAEIGYDAEWHCIPASAVGAKHTRDRIWIIAYPGKQRCNQWSSDREERHVLHYQFGNAEKNKPKWQGRECGVGEISSTDSARFLAHPNGQWQLQPQRVKQDQRGRFGDGGKDVAHPTSLGLSGPRLHGRPFYSEEDKNRETNWIIDSSQGTSGIWDIEPNVGRVANGVPNRAHRLRALGNAVVPQIPEIIGRAILNAPSH